MVTMTESDLTTGVLDLMRVLGYRTIHVRPGRVAHGWRTTVSGDGVGWPDVFGVGPDRPGRPRRLIAAELKVGRRKLTPEQDEWLVALEAAGVECFRWTDADYPDHIVQVLR